MNIDNTAALHSLNKAPEITQGLSDNDKKLKQQTDNFEAIMIKTLLDTSMKTKNHLFPKKPGNDIYQSMYRDELSKSLSGGFGYSELLFNYLKDPSR